MIEGLARHLFDRQAATYDWEPAMVELAWVDDDIRGFWIGEAQSILEFLGR